MTRDLVIIGCGGFGRELVGIVDAINTTDLNPQSWRLIGFLDDSPSQNDVQLLNRIGWKVLGPVGAVTIGDVSNTDYSIGIGNFRARRGISSKMERMGMKPATLIHPRAIIGRDVRIGGGSVVAAGAEVTTNVEIGDHVHIDRACQVGHDSTVSDFATLHPMAVVSGNCHIGSGAELGTNSTILPGIEVGAEAVVGAGACVTRNVPPGSTVKGIPAR